MRMWVVRSGVGRCTNLRRFALVRRSSEPVNGADVSAHEMGEMSGRVSWQRLALIRGQLTERDWTAMAVDVRETGEWQPNKTGNDW